jgi:hypothetical protein
MPKGYWKDFFMENYVMSKSHLERTLKCLKEANFLVQKVENFNAFSGTRHDLFGFIDILACHPHYSTIGLQVCGDDWSSHVKKMTGDRREAVILWLLAGNRCLLIGWRELKDQGWVPRVKEYTLKGDFPEITDEALVTLRGTPAIRLPWLEPNPLKNNPPLTKDFF